MAQIHVHSSQQTIPQKSGIRGRRRNRDVVNARDAGVGSSLPCVIYSAVNHASRAPTMNQGILAVLPCAKHWLGFPERPCAPIEIRFSPPNQ
jgi:hypothetical protein